VSHFNSQKCFHTDLFYNFSNFFLLFNSGLVNVAALDCSKTTISPIVDILRRDVDDGVEERTYKECCKTEEEGEHQASISFVPLFTTTFPLRLIVLLYWDIFLTIPRFLSLSLSLSICLCCWAHQS